MFFGFNITFFPQYLLGMHGMPRRYHEYPPEFQVLNVLSSAGASILALSYLLPPCYLLWSLRRGKRAGRNPWRPAGLEWLRSEEHTSELQSLMRISYAVFCYKKNKKKLKHDKLSEQC